MFNEMSMEEMMLVEGGDFYDGLMKGCEVVFVGSCSAIGGAIGAGAGAGVASGVGAVAGGFVGGYLGQKAWDAMFK